MAGVACAVQLAAAGVDVRVLERSDGPGGRMAGPQLGGRPVDIGAAYFTARDPEFSEVVKRWLTAGLVRPWTSAPAVLEAGRRGSSPGPVRYAAPGGLGSLVADLATGLTVEPGHEMRHVGPGPVGGRRARRCRRARDARPAGAAAARPGQQRRGARWPAGSGGR